MTLTGGLLGALGHLLGALGAVWEASWPVQVDKMPPEGSPKRSKMDFQRRLGLKTRFLQKLSLRLATSIKHWCSSSIQYLYFHDTNPLHWLARIHLRAPKLIVTDEFGQEFWSLPKEYQGKVRGYPTAFKMQSYVLTSWSKLGYSKGYKKVEDVLCESSTFEIQRYNFKDFDQISSKNLNFNDANPMHWLARIHLHAPKLIVTDEFTPEFWWCPRDFSCCWARLEMTHLRPGFAYQTPPRTE